MQKKGIILSNKETKYGWPGQAVGEMLASRTTFNPTYGFTPSSPMKIHDWLNRSARRPDGSDAIIPIRWAVLDPKADHSLATRAREICPTGAPVLVSFDTRTRQIASSVIRALHDQGLRVEEYLIEDALDGSAPTADTRQVHLLHQELVRVQAGLGVAVGAGTINDVMKAASSGAATPYFSFGTAASMNGYTSGIAALYSEGLKITQTVRPALGVFANPEIVGAAPPSLAQAGLGDLCSKPYAGADAAVAAILENKVPWKLPSEMVAEAFDGVLSHAGGIGRGEAEASAHLMEALWISGLSMTVAGTSAPASGGEHLWSHRLDMAQHDAGRPLLALHGTQVGVACGLVAPFFERVAQISEAEARAQLSNPSPCKHPDDDDFEIWLRSRHPDLKKTSVDKVLVEARKKHRRLHDPVRRARLASQWAEVQGELRGACSYSPRIDAALAQAGAARVPTDIGVSPESSQGLIRICRDIRDRHTILDLAVEFLGLDF